MMDFLTLVRMKRLSIEQKFLYDLLYGRDTAPVTGINADDFISLLERHKLLPLAEAVLPFLESEKQNEIKEKLTRWTARSLRLFDELKKINQLFLSQGIALTTLKGPVLSFVLYKNFHGRYYSDLDILIPESKCRQAVQIMIESGYILQSPVTGLTDSEWKKYFKHSNDIKFRTAEAKIFIELHLGIYVSQLIGADDQHLLVGNTCENLVGNVNFKVLAPESNFVYLCFHGAKHMFFRLCWLRDLYTLLKETDIDLVRIFENARKLGIESSVIIAIGLIGKYFTYSVPEIFLPFLKKPRYRLLLRWGEKIIDGPYNRVNQGGKKFRYPQKKIRGVNFDVLRSSIISIMYLILLRNGFRKQMQYLKYQLKKRI